MLGYSTMNELFAQQAVIKYLSKFQYSEDLLDAIVFLNNDIDNEMIESSEHFKQEMEL